MGDAGARRVSPRPVCVSTDSKGVKFPVSLLKSTLMCGVESVDSKAGKRFAKIWTKTPAVPLSDSVGSEKLSIRELLRMRMERIDVCLPNIKIYYK